MNKNALNSMNKRERLQLLMQKIDASKGIVKIHSLLPSDFDLVAEYLKHDPKLYPDGIRYEGMVIKEIKVKYKR